MKKIILISLILIFYASLTSAEVLTSNYGHIHLAAPDPAQAAQWYGEHFGGRVTGFGGATGEDIEIDRVYISDIPIVFFKREPGEGSVGSGVDHIGFSMADVASKRQLLLEHGATTLGELTSFRDMTVANIVDPWGTKVELIDDPNSRGLHHIHLASPDPMATLDWYHKNFGGEKARYAEVLPGIFYDNKVWLFVLPGKDIAPTQGRSVDHLGWNFSNLDQGALVLKAADVKFTMEPRDYRGIRIGFIEGPDGVRIELVQP